MGDIAKTKVLYVPLDDRDCNYEFPYQLSMMTDDMELLRPDRAWMGALKKPADIEKLWDWLFEHARECEYAILSVDTLVYGNIVGSRIHQFSQETCMERMEAFRRLKQMNPALHIHAYNLVARVAAYDSAQEDPDYWEQYGYAIWRYTYLLDKKDQGKTKPEEDQEAEMLKEKIPEDIMLDFLRRRRTDRAVNMESVKLTREGIFDILTIPKDDTSEFGYAALDQAEILRMVREYSLFNRVFVYPGADEAGSTIFARVFNLKHHYQPAVYVRYSSVRGPYVIPRYEDRPLGESVKWQILSAGGIVSEDPLESDCMLAVNAAGTEQVESSDQLLRNVNSRNNTNAEELLRYIAYFHTHYGKAIGVSDVATSNGCDNDFCDNARLHGTFQLIQAFGGWNTAENTNGVVIAQTMIAAYYHCFQNMEEQEERSDTFLARALICDWLCQANVAPAFMKEYAPSHGINPFRLAECIDEVTEYYTKSLEEQLSEKLSHQLKGKRILLKRVRFNWNGAFYFAADCALEKKK